MSNQDLQGGALYSIHLSSCQGVERIACQQISGAHLITQCVDHKALLLCRLLTKQGRKTVSINKLCQ